MRTGARQPESAVKVAWRFDGPNPRPFGGITFQKIAFGVPNPFNAKERPAKPISEVYTATWMVRGEGANAYVLEQQIRRGDWIFLSWNGTLAIASSYALGDIMLEQTHREITARVIDPTTERPRVFIRRLA